MTRNALVRQRLPEEDEIEGKLAEVERFKDRLVSIQEETEALKRRLARFEVEYTAAVGPLYVRLDRWKLRCEELRWSIEQLQSLVNIGVKVPPDADGFRRRRDEQFQSKWGDMHEDERQEAARPTIAPEPILGTDDEAELRQLYRSLAKRFHPDLVNSAEAKAAREIKMKEINDAYQSKDLGRLRQMTSDPELSDEFAETLVDKLVRLIREIARLQRLIAEAQASLAELRQGDLAQLLARIEQARLSGGDGLAILTASIQHELAETKSEWATLRIVETELWKAVD